jgi:TfoX/Sxy family transcriptional regulator of competence genes
MGSESQKNDDIRTMGVRVAELRGGVTGHGSRGRERDGSFFNDSDPLIVPDPWSPVGRPQLLVARRSPLGEPSVMPPDPGLVSRVADALATLGERTARQKNVFGGRGFLLGRSTFAIAWDDSLIVKTSRDEYPRLVSEPGVTPFAPDGERPMSTWLVVEADAIADDSQLAEWLARALRGVR